MDIYIAMLYIILNTFFALSNRVIRYHSLHSFFCRLFDSMDKIQICTIFLFQFKLGQKPAETARDINDAFGPGTTNECVTQRWFKKFRNGDESLEDEDGRGRPTAVDNEYLKTLIEADPRKITREVAVEIEVDHSTVVRHLKQIGKSKKLDKWVPHELNDNQKHCCFEVSSMLLPRNKNDLFLERIVMCDEKWILYDNRRCSAQWLDAGEAQQHFPKPKLHQKKVMVTVWWSAAGLIHNSFLNPGEMITAEKYCRQIDEMHQKLQRMCPRLVNMKGPILLHDNARPHVAQLTLQKLNELGYKTLPLIRHIHRTSRSPIITFSSISTTSCAKNASKAEMVPNRPSITSSLPELQISMLLA